MRAFLCAAFSLTIASSACGVRYEDSSIRATIVGVELDTEAHSDFTWQGGRSDVFIIDAPERQLQLHQPALALSVVVDGAELVAVQDGRTVRGPDLKGFTVTMHDSAGALAFARVDAVERDTSDPSEQTYLYSLVYVDPKTGTTTPACLPDATGTAKAMPLRGRWDATGARVDENSSITLACVTSAQARCVSLGYRPWEIRSNTSLADSHLACVRAVRGDICGDGKSYSNGTAVTLTDLLIHKPVPFCDYCAPTTPKVFETVWAPDGAYCMARDHWLSIYPSLPTSCAAKFSLFAQTSPVNPADFCIAQRNGLTVDRGLVSSAR